LGTYYKGHGDTLAKLVDLSPKPRGTRYLDGIRNEAFAIQTLVHVGARSPKLDCILPLPTPPTYTF